jgi:hypothetical protein
MRDAGGLMAGLSLGQFGAARIGRGQSGARIQSGLMFCSCRLQLLLQILSGAGQFGAAAGEAFLLGLGAIDAAQRLPFGLGGLSYGALGSHGGLRCGGQIGSRPGLRCLGLSQGLAQRRQLRIQRGETVVRLQPRRFGRAFAARDKTVPAAQMARARHQPCAGGRARPSSVSTTCTSARRAASSGGAPGT